VLVARPSSVRPASRSSQAARAAAARVAKNPEHTKILEELRAIHQARRQLNKHPQAAQAVQIPTASQAGLPTPPVYRTAPRTPRVAAFTATRTGVRDIGRPKPPPKARASARI
jgi:hypothetical protein